MATVTFDHQRSGSLATFGPQVYTSATLNYVLPAEGFATQATVAPAATKAALRLFADGFSIQTPVSVAGLINPPRTSTAYRLDVDAFVVVTDVYPQRLAQDGVLPPSSRGGKKRRPTLNTMVDGVAPVKAVFPSQYASTRITATATDTTIVHPDYEVRVDGLARVRPATSSARATSRRVRPTGVVNPTDEELLRLVVSMTKKGTRQIPR